MGVVWVAYKAAGIDLRHPKTYNEKPFRGDLIRPLERFLVKRDRPRDGDVIVMDLHNPHAGIVDGDGFWHAIEYRNVLWTKLRGRWSRSHSATYGLV